MSAEERAARIRALNDEIRRDLCLDKGKLVITAGIKALPTVTRNRVFRTVQEYATFTDDNDPRKEHDFGNFQIEGRRIFWKIDYYDPTLQYGSEDPTDPTKTTRVLTIMLAEEY